MLRISVVAFLLISTTVFAGPMPPQGVWNGTIGTKAIIACFNRGSRWTSYASYYYVDYLTPISLTTRDNDSYWHEEHDTGLWELSAPADGIVIGTWSNPKTHKTLPIKLSYVDGSGDDAACARDSYNTHLEVTPRVEASKIIQFSPGRSYRKLRFAGQETIELFAPDQAIERINSFLKLDKNKEAIDEYFQQRREFLGRVGYPAVDERLTEPTYWDANFITVRFYVSAAGYGRSGISNTYRTWSTRTGEEVDLWKWLGASSSNPRLPPKLKEYLYRNVKESSECTEGYRGQGDYTLTLDKEGLHLDEEAWGGGCEKSFFIPYVQLLQFLSPAGKQAVSSIIGQK
ncbi:MAG TPA: hypothetical protein VIU93_04180 [Gallionellaceae bacterium]